MPLPRLALDEALELIAAGDADVEVAVGRQDHAVDAVGVEALLGQRIAWRMPSAPAVLPPA